jgi:serine/threonine protein kinase
MQESIGQSSLEDFYNLEQTIGQGQFGQVKLATHKRTGLKVAVKIMGKKDIKPIEVF